MKSSGLKLTARPSAPARLPTPPIETRLMAKPNYSFEKRQREIAKKKKQDEKLAKKQASKDAETEANAPAPGSDAPARDE